MYLQEENTLPVTVSVTQPIQDTMSSPGRFKSSISLLLKLFIAVKFFLLFLVLPTIILLAIIFFQKISTLEAAQSNFKSYIAQ